MVQPYTIETHGGRAYKRTHDGIVVMATPEEQMMAGFVEDLQKQLEAAKASPTKVLDPSLNGRPQRAK